MVFQLSSSVFVCFLVLPVLPLNCEFEFKNHKFQLVVTVGLCIHVWVWGGPKYQSFPGAHDSSRRPCWCYNDSMFFFTITNQTAKINQAALHSSLKTCTKSHYSQTPKYTQQYIQYRSTTLVCGLAYLL